jgi:hypothetical protein
MMDKILDKCEEDTPITNPDEPVRTFFRKLVYRLAVWRSKLDRRGGRRSSSDGTGEERK